MPFELTERVVFMFSKFGHYVSKKHFKSMHVNLVNHGWKWLQNNLRMHRIDAC